MGSGFIGSDRNVLKFIVVMVTSENTPKTTVRIVHFK